MKKLAFLLTLVSTLFFASCDLCENTDCFNGDCDAGECFCDTGYYGDACENGYIDVLLDKGPWLINLFENDPDGIFIDSYLGGVEADPNDKLSFSIPGFYQNEGDNISVEGYVGDNWEVTIPVKVQNGVTIFGNGKIFQTPSGNLMEINISVEEAYYTRTFGIIMYPN